MTIKYSTISIRKDLKDKLEKEKTDMLNWNNVIENILKERDNLRNVVNELKIKLVDHEDRIRDLELSIEMGDKNGSNR